MKYVGIKSCRQKREALKRKGKIVRIYVSDLITKDCDRHLEFLNGNPYKYIQFMRHNGKTKGEIQARIDRFRWLVRYIQEVGYNIKKGQIVVADCGARLDGSHRAAILHWLGYYEVDVRMVKMNLTPDLEQHIKEQQYAYC